MVLITVRCCARDTYGPDFTFYLDYFLFLSSLRTFIALEVLIGSTFVSSSHLAQLVERDANNSKFLCSRLIRTKFHFLFDYFLFLSGLRTFIALKVLIWSTFISSSQLAQLVERGANKGKVMCSMLKE